MTKTGGAKVLYGAYGYTGTLIAERAKRKGRPLLLAGRREAPLRALAERLEMPWRAVALDDRAGLRELLRDAQALLLAAGPFSQTSRPAVDACLESGAHYLDVTGEIEVFEAVLARAPDARESGVALLPGVGFDVVPTDCLAKRLQEALPEACRLELAFAGSGSWSPGTARTMAEGLGQGGAVRRGGRIVRVPAGWRTRTACFHDRARSVTSIPWGDVSTAYHTTGIPDVICYMAMPERLRRFLRLSRFLAPLLRRKAVIGWLQRRIDRSVEGPSAEARARGRTQVWGRVEASDGRAVEGTLTCPEGYTFTADAALEALGRVSTLSPGAWTPAAAFGAGFVEELDGVEVRVGTPAPQP